jgi:hypothetical protein
MKDPIRKITKNQKKRAGYVALVEQLSSKHETLNSKPSIVKAKKQNNKHVSMIMSTHL